MIPDMHVHTRWSSDSSVPVREQIERAAALGMKQICITDHQDFDAPKFPPDYFTFLIDDKGDDDTVKKYVDDILEIKEEYAGRIEVLAGIELGIQPHLTEKLNAFADRFPFDFIIGSTHTFCGMDAEDKRHYENIDVEEAVRQYFMDELVNVKGFKKFDVAGHMDFVLRYGPGAAETFTYGKYADVIDEILKELIQSGRGIECNTSKFKAKNMINPDREIIRRYAELGGEIITFGSDSHVSERLGEGFKEAGEIVRECGLKYYAVFRQHKPEFYPI
ncbi:MAG TPA: histidinol-phosphatase HisJ family protein [Candidatus Avanaerovorax faecigallinarum]|nr:histidinol-phosphatase HisJ family protein [Candidatus Avanaerovorax faecigallinarum]